MSRLFYEPKSSITPTRSFESRAKNANLQYAEKIAKLVPSEIIAAYLAIVGLIPSIRYEALQGWVSLFTFILCLGITPLYLNLQAEKQKPKRNHLITSTIAFAIWAYAISGSSILPGFYDSAIASILIILFSLVSGLIPLNR